MQITHLIAIPVIASNNHPDDRPYPGLLSMVRLSYSPCRTKSVTGRGETIFYWIRTGFFALIAALPLYINAQEPVNTTLSNIEIPRLESGFVIDGVLDEPNWDGAIRITLDYEVRPGENITPPVETEVWIGEDGGGIILGFIAHDPAPEEIRAFLRDRDSAYDDDWVGVTLDTFNDERRALEFFANPYGVQMDLILDDVNNRESDAWDGIWESAGQITDFGFVVEMYIPYRTLTFEDGGGELTWGIDLVRRYPRDFQYQITSAPRDRNVDCYLCQIRKAQGMAGAEPGKNLEITPVMVITGSESTDDPANEPLEYNGTDYEPGVDIRWGITPDTTLNATLNPDFSQVEADVPQLDVNTQFTLFFPESRPFFLEGEDSYRTPINVIYTRNVADPDFGLKITGKTGPNNYGTFIADDTVTNILIPGSQGSSLTSINDTSYNFAARYRRDVGSQNSAVGAVFTGRSGDGYHNYVGGFDARWQISDSDRIRAQILLSETQYTDEIADEFDQPIGSFSDYAGSITYNHNKRNYYIYTGHWNYGTEFRADLGFIPRVDYHQSVIGGGYRWYPEEGDPDPWFQEIQLAGDWDITYDQSGQELEREIQAEFEIQSRYQSEYEIEYIKRKTFFEGQKFDEDRLILEAEMEPVGGFFFSAAYITGQAVDFANAQPGDLTSIEGNIRWNIGKNLLLRMGHEITTLDTLEGEKIFDASLTDFRATWQFSIRSFLRVTAQYEDVTRNPDVYVDPVDRQERDLAVQLLYSWTLNPQTVFFAGISQAGFRDDSLSSLEVAERTAFIKASYAWFP